MSIEIIETGEGEKGWLGGGGVGSTSFDKQFCFGLS